MTTVTEVRRRRVAKRPPALPTIALSMLLLIGATGTVALAAARIAELPLR